MLHGFLRHGPLIAAGAAAACLLAAPQTPARADAPQVTVVAPGGGQRTLSLDALAGGEDVLDSPYALRSAAGESTRTVTGFSLAAVIEAAGADPYGFSYLEVQRPDGGSVLLSRHQALDRDAFPDGPPVLYRTAGGTAFLRPSAGTEDENAGDCFEAPQGISLVLRSGSPLRVSVRASTRRTRPGRVVAFTASVDRAGAGEELAYSWYFDDGHSAVGQSVRHSFAGRGSYDVVVGVTTPGDGAGTSVVVSIQVGPPLAGPDRRGGGRSKAASAPDHGGAGTAPPTSGATAPHPSAAPAAARPPREPGPRPTRRRDRSDREPEPAKRSRGELVRGLLLSDSAAARSPRRPPPAARAGHLVQGGGGGGLPGPVVGALVAVGLLGAGALFELRGGGLAAAIGGWR